VFAKSEEYSANAKRRLDNVGSVLPHILCSASVLDHQQVLANFGLAETWDIENHFAVFLHLRSQLLSLFRSSRHNDRFDCLAILLKEGAKLLLVYLGNPLLNGAWLLKGFSYYEGFSSRLAVNSKIVCAPVGATNAFDPARRG
jgi:hypothetical protein